ncbi:MAG: type 2 isopentenyl-diphosphate Delta-isomerase [Saprospiraceae bacterium]|nr:type 2 isopentenyl-diphosphate Delta-isomerase [Saprospiraceae bacterium]
MKENKDTGASERKKDHIELAFRSRVNLEELDQRFYYEPMLNAHPGENTEICVNFLGKQLNAPIWVSSMTGGTALAGIINKNLARACGQFKLGMGLGSCRQLLNSDAFLADFQVRKYMGNQPLYANLGIAQLETLIAAGKTDRISELIKKLDADGLIIHVNPLQEWLQPEGDRFACPPLEIIQKTIDKVPYPIIVKEVGQGMGPQSLLELLKLPLAAVDFAAGGGTNFALLEILRSSESIAENYSCLTNVGHSAEEMVRFVNQIISENQNQLQCREIIISGGIYDFLDGYYLTQKLQMPSVYGQASGFLKHAQVSYETLEQYVQLQIDGYKLATKLLKVK